MVAAGFTPALAVRHTCQLNSGPTKEEIMLQAGDPVPDFDLASDTAGEVTSAGLRGQRYVLYFYPKDDTSGCTMEACSFRDNLPDFGSIGVPVYGISPDDVHSHNKFRSKFHLTFPLLADVGHRTAEDFGVWVEKNNYGKKYMGVQRSTFIIGPDGRITHVWPKVNPSDHAKEVLAYLRSESAAEQSAPLPKKEQAPAVPMEEVPMLSTELPSTEMPVMPETVIVPMEMEVEEILVVAEPEPPQAVKQPAMKSAAKKAAAKKGATKKSASKKTAVKKTATKKSASKKTAVKKTATKKTAAKKATKKAGAKKAARR
jgi:peroxiredoxin Q/BCP